MSAYFTDAEKTMLVLDGAYIPLTVPGDINSIGDGPTLKLVRDLVRNGLDISVAELMPAPVANVSARQFKLQLLAAGLLDQVDAWVASQPRAVQIAFEYSGTFVRNEPMMAQGFADMGFTEGQIDAFFEAASKL